MKKRFLALFMVAALVLSLVACGKEEPATTPTPEPTATTAPTPTTEPTKAPVATLPTEGSVDFEDGKFEFISTYLKHATSDASSFEIVDYNKSKALKVVRTEFKKKQFVAIDVSSLLGDKISDVATVGFQIGIEGQKGFNAASGKVCFWTSKGYDDTVSAAWSVYIANKNPRYFELKVSEIAAEALTAANGVLVISVSEEAAEGTNIILDNITFKDASGNIIKPATTEVAFAAPEGFEKTGHDMNLAYLENVTELEGFAVAKDGWNQDGITLTDEQKALLVPGSIIEIAYKCSEPIWMVAVSDGNPNGNWLRAVDQNTFVPEANIASDGSVIQFTYETLVKYWGEDFTSTIQQLQCEGKDKWEVYSVKVGKKSSYTDLGSKTELEGFAVAKDGWNQDGITLTDEQKALLVPGTVIEISYKCSEPIWMVAVSDGNPNGNWLRAVDQNTFVPEAGIQDGKIQFTYETLVKYWGEDFTSTIQQLQCEGKDKWEVYSVTVGKPIYATSNNVELEGFAVAKDGWNQDGITLTDEQKALLVPGSVVTIYYKCSEPIWMVAVSDGNPNGNWLRAVNQDTFIVDGTVGDGFIQYTYETLVKYWGEDFTSTIQQLQCEGKDKWEVYSVTVGQR